MNVGFNGLSGAAVNPMAASAPMFWDLRVRSLETQALEPLKALDEMRGTALAENAAVSAIVSPLVANAEYRRLFGRAFGGQAAVNERNLGRALAAFERTLLAANSPFDRYMRDETDALTPEQVRGMERFQSARCINWHSGPMFSAFTAHLLGSPTIQSFRRPMPAWATNTRRGGGRRGGPGSAGLNAARTRDRIDSLARQLNMRGGQDDLVAFLHALDDPTFDRTSPARVPSGLPVGGR